jgi:hypothetical protein
MIHAIKVEKSKRKRIWKTGNGKNNIKTDLGELGV